MIRTITLFISLSFFQITAQASEETLDKQLQPLTYGEATPRLYAVIDSSLNLSEASYTIAHMALRLGALARVRQLDLCQVPYQTAEETLSFGCFSHISAFPFIILEGKKAKIQTHSQKLTEDLNPVVLLKEEVIGKPREILAFSVFAPFNKLKPITGKFSICKSLVSITTNTKDAPTPSLSEDLGILAIVDESLDTGKTLNAIAHMSLGLGSAVVDHSLASHLFPVTEISSFSKALPIRILKGDANLIKATWQATLPDDSILRTVFLRAMHLGPTAKEQIEATKKTNLADLKITGLTLFGSLTKLPPLLQRFSSL